MVILYKKSVFLLIDILKMYIILNKQYKEKEGMQMDKYRVLLAGNNRTFIGDIFNNAQKNFELLSSSMSFLDMKNHLNVCDPDIIIYCASNESREDILKLVELKRQITRQDVVFVLTGTQRDCELFQKLAVYMVDIAIVKPSSVEEITNKVLEYMDKKKQEEQALKEEMERLEKIKQEKRRKHVLVIDDDPSVLRLIKEYLHEEYNVATAISGKIAYKFLNEKKTDLILLDYEMPVEKGPEVLENLKKNNMINGIPVLFLTGITEREKIEKALRLRPQGYLLKPVDKEKLIGTIEKFIG